MSGVLPLVAKGSQLLTSTCIRDPHRYGTETLQDVTARAAAQCSAYGLAFDSYQSNHEGHMLDRIHAARTDGTVFIVINAGAWTHTSVALVDALAGVAIPFVEVHVRRLPARTAPRLDFQLGCVGSMLAQYLPFLIFLTDFQHAQARRIPPPLVSFCQGRW